MKLAACSGQQGDAAIEVGSQRTDDSKPIRKLENQGICLTDECSTVCCSPFTTFTISTV